jgi:hypothetical protein
LLFLQFSLFFVGDMSEEEETRIVRVKLASNAHSVYVVGRDFIEADDEKTVKRKWSSTAPDWRQACNGLNLEGNRLLK